MPTGNQPATQMAGKDTGKSLEWPYRTRNAILVGVLVGCATFLLGVLADAVANRYFAPGSPVSTFADNLATSVCAGLFVLLYERRRNQFLTDRLRVIQEMNHHVRNALQVISYSARQQPDERLGTMVRESSERIEWALREILEGKSRPSA
jgi:hypothetical protein